MLLNYATYPQFQPGQNVIAIANHPPEIELGTKGTIVAPWFGSLCAVQLPDGKIHRWFAWFELAPVNTSSANWLQPGNYARIVSNIGHGEPPDIAVGTLVRILKCNHQIVFYDLMIEDGKYHRWLAETEIAAPLA